MPIDQATADLICAEIASGKSLRAVCEQEGMPDKSMFLRAVAVNEQLANQYARAMLARADARFDDLPSLLDGPERDENNRIDPAWVQWRRAVVDTEKWSLARMAPKKYGDRTVVAGDPDAPLETRTTVSLKGATPEQLRALASLKIGNDAE